MYQKGEGLLVAGVKEKNTTDEEVKEKLMMAMLESLFKKDMIDANVYKKVKAEIKRSQLYFYGV